MASSCTFYQGFNEESQKCENETLVLVLLWTVVNVGPTWWVIYANRRSAPNEERDKDYMAFYRRDYPNWSYS